MAGRETDTRSFCDFQRFCNGKYRAVVVGVFDTGNAYSCMLAAAFGIAIKRQSNCDRSP
jgi:hypothetical protein